MNFKSLTWPQVGLLLGLVSLVLGAVIVLTIYGKDTSGVLAFGGTVLVGLGVGAATSSLGTIRDNTNGRLTELHNTVKELALLLAKAAPVTPDDDQPPR